MTVTKPGHRSGRTVEFLNVKQNKLFAQMERMQYLRMGAQEEVQSSIFLDVMILDRKVSAVENELNEAGEEMKGLVVKSGKVELEGWKDFGYCEGRCRWCDGIRSPKL